MANVDGIVTYIVEGFRDGRIVSWTGPMTEAVAKAHATQATAACDRTVFVARDCPGWVDGTPLPTVTEQVEMAL